MDKPEFILTITKDLLVAAINGKHLTLPQGDSIGSVEEIGKQLLSLSKRVAEALKAIPTT